MRVFTLVAVGIVTAGAMIGSSNSARSQIVVTCADEGQTCYVPFNGMLPISYGKNGAVVTTFARDSIRCAPGVYGFSADPLVGQVKSCTFVLDIPVVWKWCAIEGQTCEIGGSDLVRFGDTQNDRWVYRTFGAPLSCTRSVFGGDPDVGIVKECQIAVPSRQ
jgi:hypothetical protein